MERANGMVLQGLKPRVFNSAIIHNRLKKFAGGWAFELLAVL